MAGNVELADRPTGLSLGWTFVRAIIILVMLLLACAFQFFAIEHRAPLLSVPAIVCVAVVITAALTKKRGVLLAISLLMGTILAGLWFLLALISKAIGMV